MKNRCCIFAIQRILGFSLLHLIRSEGQGKFGHFSHKCSALPVLHFGRFCWHSTIHCVLYHSYQLFAKEQQATTCLLKSIAGSASGMRTGGTHLGTMWVAGGYSFLEITESTTEITAHELYHYNFKL